MTVTTADLLERIKSINERLGLVEVIATQSSTSDLWASLQSIERDLQALRDRPAQVNAAQILDIVRPEIERQTRIMGKAAASLLKDIKGELVHKIEDSVGSAAADAQIGRAVAQASAESSLRLLSNAVTTLAVGGDDAPGSVQHTIKTAEAKTAKIFASIDSARDRVTYRIRPPLPDDATPDDIAKDAMMGKRPDLQYEADMIGWNSQQRLKNEVGKVLDAELQRIEQFRTVPNYISGDGQLASGLDPILRMSAEQIKLARTAGFDSGVHMDRMRGQLSGAADELLEFRQRMLPMWESALSVASAKAGLALFKAADMQALVAKQNLIIKDLTAQHRRRFSR